MEAYLSMKVSEQEILDEGKKLDPVDDKANDKKFTDRKDKDIDNDGDVDSSDEYLHKKRAATDDAIDGGKKPAKTVKESDDEEEGEEDDKKKKSKKPNPFAKKDDDEETEIDEARQMKDPKKDTMVTKGDKTIVIDKSKEAEYLKKGWTLSESQDEEEDDESEDKPFPPKKKKKEAEPEAEPEADGDSDIKKNPKTADKKAEISKIESVDTRSAFEKMWTEIAEAMDAKKAAKNATAPDKYDDTASPNDKKFIDMHKKSDKKIEDGEEAGHDVTFKAGGKTMKQAPARSGADNLKNGDTKSPK